MQYIATIYTVAGHYYLGPDTNLRSLIADCKRDIKTGEGEYLITHVYIYNYSETTHMPEGEDPLWGWMRKGE